MIGLGGIIGSGWLFASMYAGKLAGTGAYFAWLLGAALMFVFSLCLSELISLYPRRGLLASVCSFSHNKDFSFIISIANWFGTVTVIPTEGLATARYLDWPHWTAVPLIVMYAVLNIWGIKVFARFNSAITLFKFIVPMLTLVALIVHGVDTTNFHAHDLLNFHAILTTVVAGGIIYGFNGVQMIVNFTSECKNPNRDVPLALFIALSIGLCLYLGLQTAFLGSADLSIDYNSPFIQLVASINLGWLVMLLSADAAVSPSGTGTMYMASITRMLTAMSREGQLPKGFNVLHPKYHISHRSLVANVVLALVMLALFQTWQSLVVLVSAFHVISYLAAPLAVGRLRLTMPDRERAFNLPFYWLVTPALFVVLCLLFVAAGYKANLTVTIVCLAFQALYLLSNYQGKALIHAISRSAYLPLWLILLTMVSHFESDNIGLIIGLGLLLYYVGVGGKMLESQTSVKT